MTYHDAWRSPLNVIMLSSSLFAVDAFLYAVYTAAHGSFLS